MKALYLNLVIYYQETFVAAQLFNEQFQMVYENTKLSYHTIQTIVLKKNVLRTILYLMYM